jgi:gluconokinase
MTDQPFALTLDIGTSSTRVMLWDNVGREVEGVHAQVKYEMHTTSDGGVEMPAEELLAHVCDCMDQALKLAGDRAHSIRAVGMSTFWHSLLGLDESGKPLTPVYNWADTRAGRAAQQLRQTLDEAAVHARTGCMIHPSYYPAKLVWLRDTQPGLYSRVARWASPSEYLYGLWFGAEARRVSLSMASGTGLLDQQRCVWDEQTLQAIGVSVETLAPIEDLSQQTRGLQHPYADRWPALRDVPFFPAVGDGACGNVGSGCISAERYAINLGTSGAIRVLWTETSAVGNPTDSTPEHPTPEPPNPQTPNTPPGLWRYRVDSRRPLMGAAFSDGGIVYEWMTRTLDLPGGDELERQLAAVPPGKHGLIFLPFLMGERSLGWNPDARASLIGISIDTRPLDILHAAMEAVALRFALAAQRLQAVFPQVKEMVASGGALSHSSAWTQMFADAIGQPIIMAEEPEASSRGAALLAMEAAGLIDSAAEPSARLGRIYTPDPARYEIYRAMLARQEELYTELIAKSPKSLNKRFGFTGGGGTS